MVAPHGAYLLPAVQNIPLNPTHFSFYYPIMLRRFTSAAMVLRGPPCVYNKPQISRRLLHAFVGHRMIKVTVLPVVESL
jgi:hypothetical protein